MSNSWPKVSLEKILKPLSRPEAVGADKTYKILGARLYAGGLYIKNTALGATIRADKLYRVEQGDFVYNRLFAWKGSFALSSASDNGCYVSNEFPCFKIDTNQAEPSYLKHYFSRASIWDEALALSSGGTPTSRNRLKEEKFLSMKIPLPPLPEQRRIVARIEELVAKIEEAHRLKIQAEEETEALGGAFIQRILERNLKNPQWEWQPLKAFVEINPNSRINFNSKPPDRVTFVPMAAVDDITGVIERPQTRDFLEVSKGYTCFLEGDVIFARITPCMQNGKSAIAKNLVNSVSFGSTEFHVIRPGPKLLNHWLHILVRQKSFREDAMAHFKGTAGQQRVPQSFLEEKIIPVPPLQEQRQLVERVISLQSNVTNLRNLQQKSAAELDAMLPSILDNAFKGKL